jgi:predicted RNase H-like HicB family nuclease
VKGEMATHTRIPVRVYHDDEAGNWHCHVPELHIVGGGDATREASLAHAADAIAFLLEGEAPEGRGGLEYLPVAVG